VKRKKLVIEIAIIGVTAVIVVAVRLCNPPLKDTRAPGDGPASGFSFSNLFGSTSFFKDDLDLKKVIADEPEIEMIIGKMKERYGKKLSEKRIQIRLLGGLIRHLKKKYPYDWKERIRVIIAAEFPEYAVELTDKLDKLDEYFNYLKNNRGELQYLDRAEKKAAMLARRREIFGPECDEIWEQEIATEKISDMLGRLDGRSDLSAYDKMRAYSTFTKSLYPESADLSSGKSGDEIMVRNYDLANSFLDLGSVQSDLGGMSPDERTRFLRQLRQSVGLQEDTVRKMAEVDALRDRLWENGPAYNRERGEILAKYDGDERERKLDDARKRYFGASAGMIKFEEDTFKFNRFQFPRRWGKD
jgi:hypothetical protein